MLQDGDWGRLVRLFYHIFYGEGVVLEPGHTFTRQADNRPYAGQLTTIQLEIYMQNASTFSYFVTKHVLWFDLDCASTCVCMYCTYVCACMLHSCVCVCACIYIYTGIVWSGEGTVNSLLLDCSHDQHREFLVTPHHQAIFTNTSQQHTLLIFTVFPFKAYNQ